MGRPFIKYHVSVIQCCSRLIWPSFQQQKNKLKKKSCRNNSWSSPLIFDVRSYSGTFCHELDVMISAVFGCWFQTPLYFLPLWARWATDVFQHVESSNTSHTLVYSENSNITRHNGRLTFCLPSVLKQPYLTRTLCWKVGQRWPLHCQTISYWNSSYLSNVSYFPLFLESWSSGSHDLATFRILTARSHW